MVGISCRYAWDPNSPDDILDTQTGQTLSRTALATKIDVYQDRVQGWFLNYIDKLRQDGDSGYVRLALAVAQVEGVQQYREGRSSNNQSKAMFERAIMRVFGLSPTAQTALGKLYRGLRCGLFHDGFTKGAVYISEEYTSPITHDAVHDILKVNPQLFADAVIGDFRAYCAELKQGADPQLVRNFETMWDQAWQAAKGALSAGTTL